MEVRGTLLVYLRVRKGGWVSISSRSSNENNCATLGKLHAKESEVLLHSKFMRIISITWFSAVRGRKKRQIYVIPVMQYSCDRSASHRAECL